MKEKLFHTRNIIKLTGAAAGVYICLRYSAECTKGIVNGIMFCIQVLIPSLFLFMVLSAFLVKSEIAEMIAKPLDKLSKKLFRLPCPALAAIILAMVGGYPVGARCVELYYDSGKMSRNEAEATAAAAVCAGPGFLINFVGKALLGSPDAGVILLISQIFSTVAVGIIAGRVIKHFHNERSVTYKQVHKENLLTEAVADASKSTFYMCGMVVICAALIEVIAVVIPDHTVCDIISACAEITSGCAVMCRRYPLALIAFFIGFGGLSVHLQIFAGCPRLKIRKGIFFILRVIQGIIMSAVTYILLMIFPIEISVFNSTSAPLTVAKTATTVGSAALVICALCFIGTLRKNGGKYVRDRRLVR